MKKIFIDTSFVIALINQKDKHHLWALNLSELLESNSFVTTDLILYEIANYLAKDFKAEARNIIYSFINSNNIEIIWHNEKLFLDAFKNIHYLMIKLGA